MRVTTLGTGTSQGVPVIACDCEVCLSLDYHDKRTRTSIHIETEGKSFIIDTGPDFRNQVLRERIKQLDAIIFTHEHKDHTAGLDDVRAFNFRQQKDMPIYAKHNVIEQLKQEFSYAFGEKKYPGVPQIKVYEIDNSPFEVEGVLFTPIQVMHLKLPVFGFRVKDFSYITDANYISEEEKEKVKGSKVLVLNALQKETHISHFNLEQAIALAEEIGAEQTYFTHISHRMGLHKEVKTELPDNMHLAHDGLTIEM
ncbi:MBL fold metallo-hydrolase [Fulvivirga ligni]|uniref:MBL fold metallo-hydrolase n=1 Tax=Fulvivirga ligni TaxID=2904246 RepID=UPI001F4225C1|nr:MBL fold metallo-hydrolase [Fulvivirga ligni]UII23548.1 MBL fold metallo-hydrolase [Fulvivirga ligni]